jgi:HSP20 family protein
MKLDEMLKQGFTSFWDSVAEGWQHLRQSASSALTRFKPGDQTNLPAKSEIDDVFYMPAMSWSMLGGDVFENDSQVVVRLEVPGMDKNDLAIDVQGDTLLVRGEKRFERENTEGRYRTLQCAYGSFQRAVTLPSDVLADQANAAYKNGVLRIVLPKAKTEPPRKTTIKVD